jgi:hypothetical protein
LVGFIPPVDKPKTTIETARYLTERLFGAEYIAYALSRPPRAERRQQELAL